MPIDVSVCENPKLAGTEARPTRSDHADLLTFSLKPDT